MFHFSEGTYERTRKTRKARKEQKNQKPFTRNEPEKLAFACEKNCTRGSTELVLWLPAESSYTSGTLRASKEERCRIFSTGEWRHEDVLETYRYIARAKSIVSMVTRPKFEGRT